MRTIRKRTLRIQYSRDEISRILCFVICFLCLIFIIGCYGAEVVRIKVGVDSEVDMKKYKAVAVLDFVDSRKNSTTDEGRILARMIRKQLRNSKDFNILDEGSMNLALEMELDKRIIDDEKVLKAIAERLIVDALVIGTFDFRRISRPMPYIVERYSSEAGRYVPETRTYVQNSYHFSFHAKVIDGQTAETIYEFSPKTEMRPEYRRRLGMPFAAQPRANSISLRSMATRPVTAFAMSLVPHYEYERRILAR